MHPCEAPENSDLGCGGFLFPGNCDGEGELALINLVSVCFGEGKGGLVIYSAELFFSLTSKLQSAYNHIIGSR